ncbi:LiaI-LiaF-like domain-containing protein [Caloramator sp. Dgby_cultured_2]|uniref:LiaI-LiaF-like domain-containing protein n=1 Tax=Caloramator sp. Dgby_cultured_2 TaxID=3029174 RepID=UPI00406C914B
MKSYLWGLVFILVGIFLIIQRTFLFDVNLWNFVWPIFLIIPGIAIHYNYFSKTKEQKFNIRWNLNCLWILLFIFYFY